METRSGPRRESGPNWAIFALDIIRIAIKITSKKANGLKDPIIENDELMLGRSSTGTLDRNVRKEEDIKRKEKITRKNPFVEKERPDKRFYFWKSFKRENLLI